MPSPVFLACPPNAADDSESLRDALGWRELALLQRVIALPSYASLRGGR
jgi:hypothetical protein